MPQIAPIASKTALERQFLLALKTVLDRAYQDGVDQFYNWTIDGDTIIGVFRDGGQGYKFSLNGKGLIYNPVGKNRRDGEIEGATLANSAMRLDAGRAKRRKCKGVTTYACGGACLPNKKVCRLNSKHIVSDREMKSLLALGNSLSKPLIPEKTFEVFEKPIVDLTPKANRQPKKSLDDMTIRELRAEAQSRGVPGYSHVDKETLKAMVVTWDKEPEAQKRIVKVIEKRKKERDADPFTEFKRFFGLKKVLGAGSAITAALILKVSLHSYNKVKDRYQGNFSTSAEVARQRLGGIEVPNILDNQDFITFTVDRRGTENTGTLKSALMEADPKFFKKHHIVSVGSDAFDDPPTKAEDEAKEKVKSDKGLARTFETYTAVASKLSSQVSRGRDPQAIELAAQVLAYHKKYPDRQFNLIGDHDGGMVVNEAAEIIRRADKDLASNLRVVNLGTPHFGLTEQVTSTKGDNDGQTLTISSASDATILLPKLNNYQVNAVKGGEAKEYLGNKHSLEVIRGALGYYSDRNTTKRHNQNDPYHPRNKEGFDFLTPEERRKAIYDYHLAIKRAEADTPSNRLKRTAGKNAEEELERHEKYLKRNKLGIYGSPDDEDNPPAASSSSKKPKPGSGGSGEAAKTGGTKETGTSGKKTAESSQSSAGAASLPPVASKPEPAINPDSPTAPGVAIATPKSPASTTSRQSTALSAEEKAKKAEEKAEKAKKAEEKAKKAEEKAKKAEEEAKKAEEEAKKAEEEAKKAEEKAKKKRDNPRSMSSKRKRPADDDFSSYPEEKKDAPEQSAAYREAFLLTANRFRRS